MTSNIPIIEAGELAISKYYYHSLSDENFNTYQDALENGKKHSINNPGVKVIIVRVVKTIRELSVGSIYTPED